ncbi:hypothetical protein BH23GEM6_BH23GEM6_25060 [soil metagenome]
MNWIAIGWAGFIATTLATAVFWAFRSTGWTLFSPTNQIGGIFFREPDSPSTETFGFVVLFLLGSSLVPALYSLIMQSWMGEGWRAGLLLGVLHGIIVVAALPLIGTISASVRNGPLPHPGRLGLSWGRITPLAIVLGHVTYGAIVGAILAGF